MATEDVKKARLMKLFNSIVFGFGKGLYDLFGEASVATASSIGGDVIAEMEREMGLEITGEDPKAILREIGRLLEDEYGLFDKAHSVWEEHGIKIYCNNCKLWHATEEMLANGAPALHCVPMMIAEAALLKRLGKRSHLQGIHQDKETHVCELDFRFD